MSRGVNVKIISLQESLIKKGYVVLDWTFFSNISFANSLKRENLDVLLSRLTPSQDQPGCIRYYLCGIDVKELLNLWLKNHILSSLVFDYFGTKNLQVNFYRYREPVYGRGMQRLHYDWLPSHSEKRLELFIAFDSTTLENGCTQVVNRLTNQLEYLPLKEGSVLILDSKLLHRGTRNRSGERRRIIDVQIGPLNSKDSAFECVFSV